jgi:protoheme IX farnesyltransferase
MHRRVAHRSVLSDYWRLTKPEINFLVAITAGTGFWIGQAGSPTDATRSALLQVVLGTALVASGAATLNQVIELPYDAQMRRTARRPLASGRIARAHGLWFGVGLSAVGVSYLALLTNTLAALLAALTLLGYLFIYTPLKRITPLCTVIGAIPGAAPPLIGWAAARGQLDPKAWLLFAIVFLWQLPHFTPIAWMYRDDYARAGYRMLPCGETVNRFVAWQTLAAAAVLMVVSLLPAIIGLEGGFVYGAFAVALGGPFLFYSARFARRKTSVAARRLLIVSILYLPALFALLVLDK